MLRRAARAEFVRLSKALSRTSASDMQTISNYVVHYRNVIAKGNTAAVPILADVIINRCPVQDLLWISVVQLNRGRKELVFERIPCGIENAAVSVRFAGATMLVDVHLKGSKDASDRTLFRNLQFAGPAPPRRFALHFQSISEAEEFLYRVQNVLELGELDEATVQALGPTLEGTDLPPALTCVAGAKGKRKKKRVPGDEASQALSQSQALPVAVVTPAPAPPSVVASTPGVVAVTSATQAESQQLSGNVSEEITFRLDVATGTIPAALQAVDAKLAAQTAAVETKEPPAPTPAPQPMLTHTEQPVEVRLDKPTAPDPKELCGVCKLAQFALEKDQGMIYCDKCQKWYHVRCGGLTEAQYNSMSDATPYLCKACIPSLVLPQSMPNGKAKPAPPRAALELKPAATQTRMPEAAVPANSAPNTAKRKLDDAGADGSQQLPAGHALAPPPSQVVVAPRAPSFRAPLEVARPLVPAPVAAPSQPGSRDATTATTHQRPGAATATASQASVRANSPPKSQGFAVTNVVAISRGSAGVGGAVGAQQSRSITTASQVPAGGATVQREQMEDLGLFQSILQAMKSATPMPSAAEQAFKGCIAECLRDPSFPDLVAAVESVWKELEDVGKLARPQAK